MKDEEYTCSVLHYLKDVLDENYCFEIQREIAMTTYQKILTGAFDESDPLPFMKEYIQREDLNIYVKRKRVLIVVECGCGILMCVC